MVTTRNITPAGLAFLLLLAAAPVRAGRIDGTVAHPKVKENMLVYVVKAEGTFAPKPVTMSQKAMKFSPYVMGVLVGSTVDFMNEDSVVHNVMSPDQETYNLGNWLPGMKRSYTFKREGMYSQLCLMHPEMEGYIMVTQNPYFATVEDGKFSIPDVPDGTYELKVWAKPLKKDELAKSWPVTVKDGVATMVLFGANEGQVQPAAAAPAAAAPAKEGAAPAPQAAAPAAAAPAPAAAAPAAANGPFGLDLNNLDWKKWAWRGVMAVGWLGLAAGAVGLLVGAVAFANPRDFYAAVMRPTFTPLGVVGALAITAGLLVALAGGIFVWVESTFNG